MGRFTALHREGRDNGFIDVRDCAARGGLDPDVARKHLRSIGWEPWIPGLWVPQTRSRIIMCDAAPPSRTSAGMSS